MIVALVFRYIELANFTAKLIRLLHNRPLIELWLLHNNLVTQRLLDIYFRKYLPWWYEPMDTQQESKEAKT